MGNFTKDVLEELWEYWFCGEDVWYERFLLVVVSILFLLIVWGCNAIFPENGEA